MKRFVAIFTLGIYFFIHLFTLAINKITKRKTDPYKQFVEQFRADNLKPLPPQEEMLLINLQHCTGCQLCTLHYHAANLLALRELRDLSQIPDCSIIDDLKNMPPSITCPFGVDIQGLSMLMQKRCNKQLPK